MQNKKTILVSVVIAGCLLLALSGWAGELATSGPADLLALAAPPEGWRELAPPMTAVGNELFRVINGGAELYVRLGFTRAVFASYRSETGKDINLEIYQMKTPKLAREVYAGKVGRKGTPAKLGTEALFEAYYLNFFRGTYQVTVSGYDSGSRTVAGIFAIAGEVDARLPRH